MNGYLLDTCVISSLLNPLKANHGRVREAIDCLAESDIFYISVITLAELQFGIELGILQGHKEIKSLNSIINQAQRRPILEVTRHTAKEYGLIKALVASKYLEKALRKEGRPRWPEEWIDKASGKKLQIDENDLWLTAQACDRNLTLLTNESHLDRIQVVVPTKLKIFKI